MAKCLYPKDKTDSGRVYCCREEFDHPPDTYERKVKNKKPRQFGMPYYRKMIQTYCTKCHREIMHLFQLPAYDGPASHWTGD